MTRQASDALWSATEKLACVERELRYRIKVYARLVAEGRMTERQAGREIAIMGAIVEDYRKLRDLEEPELGLE
jgi:hypothetical protein